MNVVHIRNELDKLTAEYNKLFEETLPEFELDGSTLAQALKSQSIINIQWEIMSKKLNKLFDDCEILVEDAYSEAFTDAYKSEKYRELSTTEAKERAKANTAYQTACKTLNEVRCIRDECRGILDVVISRRYILNNMTNSIIASVEKNIL